MSKIPFSKQTVPLDPAKQQIFEPAREALERDGFLPSEQVIHLLERSECMPLPSWLTKYLVSLLRKEVKRKRGRKVMAGAWWDFTMADCIEQYEVTLAKLREEDRIKRAKARAVGENLPRAEVPASERAAGIVLKKMNSKIRNITPKRLLNRISASKKINVREDDELPPDEDWPPNKALVSGSD